MEANELQVRREDESRTEPLVDFSPSEVAVTMAEFLLSGLNSVPESEKQAFKQFAVMFSNCVALTNIKRWERLEWVMAFREICILLDFGDYTTARNMMGEYLMTAQLSRSIDGLNMLYGMQGVTRKTVEYMQPKESQEESQKKGLLGRLVGGLRGRS